MANEKVLNFLTNEVKTENSRLTLAVANVTGKLFCGYHQGSADALTGEYIERRRIKRWMCATCMQLRGIAPKINRAAGPVVCQLPDAGLDTVDSLCL